MEKVHLISLGCPKNQVDSEVILGLLLQDGLISTSRAEEADVVIVNTCAFIQEAVRESIEVILELSKEKETGRIERLVVTGCLPQRYGEDLAREIPEVDLWMGTGDFPQIPRWLWSSGPKVLIGKPHYLYDHQTPRVIANTPHSAYVKIAEGCSHPCTFCLIPQLRGRYRSRAMDSVVQEAEDLVARGVVEINLVAQDTTAYGIELSEEGGLWRLMEELIKIRGLRWIRVLYTYPHPANFPQRLLEVIAGEEKVCPYLDIPIQHINDGILHRMGRRSSGSEIRELIYRIKKDYAEIHLRTTLMVGFPGEGEREFQELLAFVKETEFTHLGVFRYSPEEGTRSFRMKGKAHSQVAEERAAQVMELQQAMSWKRNQGMVGSVIPVLVDGVSDEPNGFLLGRTCFQAPEVDGVVYVEKGVACSGKIESVKITQAGPYDLVGELQAMA